MNAKKIMVVEDDVEILELLNLYLSRYHYQVIKVTNGKQTTTLVKKEDPDLLLLDIMLPDMDGMRVCEEVRKFSTMPIIFISCKRESEDIIHGLDLGADDYITKPFDPNVVIARIKAQLRRNESPQSKHLTYLWKDERLEIDGNSLEVRVENQSISLYVKERQLLLFLVKHPNQVFSVDQLFDQVWGWDKRSDKRTVMVHIRNLRKKIEKDPAKPKYIQTVRGFGYKFKRI